ncbi:serine protease [Ideonella sp. A 288]|uniref:trypsin-like serine peptidase n=1 Tax=Ideonella sp. A 288 TaxID=1962181 RepID=UPI000B4BAFBB|nr:trypsin-like peptidase domain-containing protein [Ideonella sp. A 288]
MSAAMMSPSTPESTAPWRPARQREVAPVPAPAAADAWIALEDPATVFPGMVPGAVRIDETRIGKSAYEATVACHIDDDQRQPLGQMRERPYRWLCKLQVVVRDPDDGALHMAFGSGLLIGERHVLTAAHVLVQAQFDASGRFRRTLDATAVAVIPGLDGRGRKAGGAAADTMPFGWTHGANFRCARVFRLASRASGSEPKDFDYAVIRLADAIGARRFASLGGAALGHWGHPAHGGLTRMNGRATGSLKGVKVNAVGYPQDKCRDVAQGRDITRAEHAACPTADLGSVPWVGFDRIAASGTVGASFGTLDLDSAAAPGMSGGPVWLRWQSARDLIGIVHGCDATSSKDNPFVGSIATLITPSVKRDIQSWLR